MLTRIDFQTLWTNPFPNGFNQTLLTLSLYDDYVLRHIYLNDYLDLFRGGIITYPRTLKKKGWIVTIGDVDITVDYDHPFKAYLSPTRKVKYVLIAEAPPPMSAFTYFYHIGHGEGTPYFSQPIKAFGINPNLNKTDKLLELANRGVLLLDLFPFNFPDIKDFRPDLLTPIPGSTAENFWSNNKNPYALEKRINELKDEKIFHQETRATMMAPRTLSHHLIEGMLFRSLPDFGFNWRNVVNTFVPPHAIIQNNEHFIGTLGHTFIGIPPHLYLLSAIKKVPIYASSTCDGSGNPNSTLIKNALGLP